MLEINDLKELGSHPQAMGGVLRRQLKDFKRIRGALLILATLCMGQVLLASVIFCAGEPASFERKAAEAFAEYVRATEARNDSELKRGDGLLWIDALPEAERKRDYAALAQGEVEIEKRNTLADGREIPCPGGMIHHWEGLIFVPEARLDDVLRVLEDYDHHPEYYAPDVVRSKIEAHDGDHFKIYLRFRRQKVITAVLNTNHEVRYFHDSATRAHSRSSATHIAEVENPGKRNEREKPRDEDNGFLWGMETWWRMEEKDGGVYVQSEVVSLTRDLPAGLGWMIGPFITSIPKETLTFTLEATRKAVLTRQQPGARGRNADQ
jgi:hypothetical protein